MTAVPTMHHSMKSLGHTQRGNFMTVCFLCVTPLSASMLFVMLCSPPCHSSLFAHPYARARARTHIPSYPHLTTVMQQHLPNTAVHFYPACSSQSSPSVMSPTWRGLFFALHLPLGSVRFGSAQNTSCLDQV